ncbi:MAG: 16S rRNA processing protein RimM [Deltaproteobacteria bacterium]|jgi:16S rRNA processing protein RimM|nr:16S rRNA processing protein RimM [Deltaproteobacteria bacterium]
MTRKTDLQEHDLQEELVVIGEVVKPHGIRGEIKAFLFSEKPGNFKQYKKIFLQEKTGGRTAAYRVVNSREQGKLAILKLENVDTREAAEALQGMNISLNKADFPALDPDEYYWHQLKGLAVKTETGRELGRVKRLFNAAAHDIMVVTGAGHEYMIPVNRDIIREIDEAGGTIIISAPPGLLEMNK